MFKFYLGLVFLALIAVLCFGVYYYHEKSESYCSLYKNAIANNNILIKAREKDYEKILETSRRQQELEELAKLSNESCWSRIISSTDPVLVRLHQD